MFNYLDNNGEDLGLSSPDIDLLKAWFNIVAYGMFGLFVLEIIRYKVSMKYRAEALRIDGEFDALLDEDNKAWNEKIQSNKSAREGKYSDMRAHYKAKYSSKPMEENHF